jgi:hypothetical protein
MDWTAIFVCIIALFCGAVLYRNYAVGRKISLQSAWSQLQKDGSPQPCPDVGFFTSRTEATKGMASAHFSPNLSFVYVFIPGDELEELLVVTLNGHQGQLKLKFCNGEYTEGHFHMNVADAVPLKNWEDKSLAVSIINAVRTRSDSEN